MAKKEITLPSGAKVTLRDPESLRVKDRKVVYRAAANEEGVMRNVSMIDGIIAIIIEDWSFDLIIPSIKLSSLDELTMADYDALEKEAAKIEKVLFPAVAATLESESDPESPFVESND